MNNLGLATEALKFIAQKGVREIVVCAGARNSPMVSLLDHISDVQIYRFFEERSASFFALGRIMATEKPVAVLTTSGTAVAELLPAMIEAHYAGLPLVALTADRPVSYRGSGAPQAIEQAGLFGKYAQTMDLEKPDFSDWDGKKPLQLNLCFDEPLVEKSYEKQSWNQWFQEVSCVEEKTDCEIVEGFCEKVQNPLILLGALPKRYQSAVLEVCRGKFVYAEGPSGLRESFENPSDKWVQRNIDQFDSVIRIGGVPTLRAWRDLENSKMPVLSLGEFSGLARESLLQPLSFESLKALKLSEKKVEFESHAKLFENFPLSEPALLRKLSKKLNVDQIYIGNSLPIREWDLAAHPKQPMQVFANRGANGIDGQLSTFLGMAEGEAWGIFGDLTTLYDLTSPWALRERDIQANIVVINNGGGQIFSRIFESPSFINEHSIDFSSWAKMWNLDYELWEDIPEDISASRSRVIELRPEESQSMAFWGSL